MKMHKLYREVEIIKESEKAVCVNNIEISRNLAEMGQIAQCLGQRVYANKKPFWVPKSQITIENNKIVAITKWYYNQSILYLDSPFCLEEDIKRIEKDYLPYYKKGITELSTLKDNMIKGARE